jgi:hypothetical protein
MPGRAGVMLVQGRVGGNTGSLSAEADLGSMIILVRSRVYWDEHAVLVDLVVWVVLVVPVVVGSGLLIARLSVDEGSGRAE